MNTRTLLGLALSLMLTVLALMMPRAHSADLFADDEAKRFIDVDFPIEDQMQFSDCSLNADKITATCKPFKQFHYKDFDQFSECIRSNNKGYETFHQLADVVGIIFIHPFSIVFTGGASIVLDAFLYPVLKGLAYGSQWIGQSSEERKDIAQDIAYKDVVAPTGVKIDDLITAIQNANESRVFGCDVRYAKTTDVSNAGSFQLSLNSKQLETLTSN